MGHERPIYDVRILSACPPIATKSLRRKRDGSGTYLDVVGRRTSSGSLAKFAGMRRVSSLEQLHSRDYRHAGIEEDEEHDETRHEGPEYDT